MGDNFAAKRVNTFVEGRLDDLAGVIETSLEADVMALVGPIYAGLDSTVRAAIESRNGSDRTDRPRRLGLLLTTVGGVIEVVERIVKAIRSHYDELIVVVPDYAMSAGTVLALSADRIMMDYFACLGPIDPQIERSGKLVPALSYLVQFERLKQRAGQLSTAELVLLQQLDLAELHKFEEAKELSVSLLKEWLATYKFKDWKVTETQKKPVTQEMREERAIEIASRLMDHQRWHSHGRSIHMDVLRNDLNLKIEDFAANKALGDAIHSYHFFLTDYMSKVSTETIVHTQKHCLTY